MNKVTVAAVQAGTVLFDTRRTLEKLEFLCREAAERGAQLVLFPEAYIGGYPKGITFGATVESRSPEGREQFRAYYEAAIDVPGPETAAIGEIGRARDRTRGRCDRAGWRNPILFCVVLRS